MLAAAAVAIVTAAPTMAQSIFPSRSTSLAESSIAARTAQYREQALEALSPRVYVPSLVGRVVPHPTTVQGLGQTVVAGSVVVNPGIAGGSVLEARCPRLPYGRVIVNNNRILNGGRVVDGGSGSGVSVIDCRGAMPGSTVTVTGNEVRSLGSLH